MVRSHLIEITKQLPGSSLTWQETRCGIGTYNNDPTAKRCRRCEIGYMKDRGSATMPAWTNPSSWGDEEFESQTIKAKPGATLYKCHHCGVAFDSEGDAVTHTGWHFWINCDPCNMTFSYYGDLVEHRLNEHDKSGSVLFAAPFDAPDKAPTTGLAIQCADCKARFDYDLDLADHNQNYNHSSKANEPILRKMPVVNVGDLLSLNFTMPDPLGGSNFPGSWSEASPALFGSLPGPDEPKPEPEVYEAPKARKVNIK